MTTFDDTHDPSRTSWVESANGHADFPIQNLPFGVFAPKGLQPRGGIAIGNKILDLDAWSRIDYVPSALRKVVEAAAQPTLNGFFSLGSGPRAQIRRELSAFLANRRYSHYDNDLELNRLLFNSADCLLGLPADVRNYTDFFAGIHHAENAARRRSVAGLFSNYKYVPIAYHGRASSVRASGPIVKRPFSQFLPPGKSEPRFGATSKLDFELEIGTWIGPGNSLGEPISIGSAGEHIAGYCLLNDLSARDFQTWESHPLGPFLSKNFGTVLSPWVITPEALAPFRIPRFRRSEGDPQTMAYLDSEPDASFGGLDIQLHVQVRTAAMRDMNEPFASISQTSSRNLYWTPAQMVAHHTVGGCNLVSGDLLGSGTISGPSAHEAGSLIELTDDGRNPLLLPNGDSRSYLEDGDEVRFTGRCEAPGRVGIGFGECVVRISG